MSQNAFNTQKIDMDSKLSKYKFGLKIEVYLIIFLLETVKLPVNYVLVQA